MSFKKNQEISNTMQYSFFIIPYNLIYKRQCDDTTYISTTLPPPLHTVPNTHTIDPRRDYQKALEHFHQIIARPPIHPVRICFNYFSISLQSLIYMGGVLANYAGLCKRFYDETSNLTL